MVPPTNSAMMCKSGSSTSRRQWDPPRRTQGAGRFGQNVVAGAVQDAEQGLDPVPANKSDLPFVITIEPATEEVVRGALEEMSKLDFLVESPLALPIEPPLSASTVATK